MTCFHPMTLYRDPDGNTTFRETKNSGTGIKISCGSCKGCRLRHAREWSIRCVHEARSHQRSSFVTLTYNSENYSISLNYRDLQLFLKRLRKQTGPFRYYAVGEYGESTLRPHFHLLLFGYYPSDQRKIGKDLYSSPSMEKTWGKGNVSHGQVTRQSAAYCTAYAMKKITGARAEEHYRRVDERTGEIVQCEPEMAHMSLNPAIGRKWIEKHWKDVYVARDAVVIDGKELPTPRYYDKILEDIDANLLEDKKFDRFKFAEQHIDDTTEIRMIQREIYTIETAKMRKRNQL